MPEHDEIQKRPLLDSGTGTEYTEIGNGVGTRGLDVGGEMSRDVVAPHALTPQGPPATPVRERVSVSDSRENREDDDFWTCCAMFCCCVGACFGSVNR